MQDALPPHTWLPFAFWLVEFVILAITVAGVMRVFSKGGAPGWAALVPVYNLVQLLRLSNLPLMPYLLLLFFPCVNVVLFGVIHVHLAKRFGRGTAFGLGLAYLPFLFYPLLGFGEARCLEPIA